jgi:salicylate hydroxylase
VVVAFTANSGIKIPGNNIHLNHRCIGFTQDNYGVDIYFDSDKTVRSDS